MRIPQGVTDTADLFPDDHPYEDGGTYVGDCYICQEMLSSADDDLAEMTEPGGESFLVHADCGLLKGWEVS